MAARIIGTRLPCCPGRDSRFTIKHNRDQVGGPWWIYYEPPSNDPIPADEGHEELISIVNQIKRECAGTEGGAFSINEHQQIIARAAAPPSSPGNTIHIVNVTSAGTVSNYSEPITFLAGKLDPRAIPTEGSNWAGPLSGMTYKFAAPGNPKPPSRNLDEVFVDEEGIILQLSNHAGIDPYPPAIGPLANFVQALRRQLPQGGRFRVNEVGRAFTSNGSIFIGTIPHAEWFRPLNARS